MKKTLSCLNYNGVDVDRPGYLTFSDSDIAYKKLEAAFRADFEKESHMIYQTGTAYHDAFRDWIEENTLVDMVFSGGIFSLTIRFSSEEDLTMFKLQWC